MDAREMVRIAWIFSAGFFALQHLNRLSNAALACLFFFGFVDPGHVFFLMRVGQLIEDGFGFLVYAQYFFQLCWDFCECALLACGLDDGCESMFLGYV
jgi:hypothetical protein